MVEAGVDAATDVTGFGLLGHLHIALEASGAAARVDAARMPLLGGTLELADGGSAPPGPAATIEFVSPTVDWGTLPTEEQLVLADAQTSGGMLIAVPRGSAPRH